MAQDKDLNLDPITKEPGAHPVGTGVGAAAGGVAAGAAVGAFAGPVGAVVGAVAGAVAGGLGGKAVAEAVNPTAEEAYWREAYVREPYYADGRSYDDYAPAYDLGWSSRAANAEQPFDAVEPRLAADWDARRGGSSLTWPEARPAIRAAWDRIDSRGTGDDTVAEIYADGADRDDAIDVLNDLLETSRDGEYGFRKLAEYAQAPEVKALLERGANASATAASELLAEIVRLGGKPDEGGTVTGAIHRGWVSVRGTLTGHSDKSALDEAERGEDAALARYRKAAKEDGLPASVRTLIDRQLAGAQRNHDEVKALRDRVRAAG